jgi:hypothetical protein
MLSTWLRRCALWTLLLALRVLGGHRPNKRGSIVVMWRDSHGTPWLRLDVVSTNTVWRSTLSLDLKPYAQLELFGSGGADGGEGASTTPSISRCELTS